MKKRNLKFLFIILGLVIVITVLLFWPIPVGIIEACAPLCHKIQSGGEICLEFSRCDNYKVYKNFLPLVCRVFGGTVCVDGTFATNCQGGCYFRIQGSQSPGY